MRVALLQMTSHRLDVDANLATGEDHCRRAAAMDADVALFPEMWSVGYTLPREGGPGVDEWRRHAVPAGSPFVKHFAGLASELDMAIALTFLEEWEPSPRNSVALIDRRGDVLFVYAKVHTCEFDAERHLVPGEAFPVASLDTREGPVEVGAMICFDREFPESARVLMLAGAEVILTPNSCDLDDTRIGQFRARAFENMVGVAMANYPAPKDNGRSCAFSPVVYDQKGTHLDPLIVEAGAEEGVFLADFDLDEIRAYRRREPWGNAFRRPRAYRPLVSQEVREPFVRKELRS